MTLARMLAETRALVEAREQQQPEPKPFEPTTEQCKAVDETGDWIEEPKQ